MTFARDHRTSSHGCRFGRLYNDIVFYVFDTDCNIISGVCIDECNLSIAFWLQQLVVRFRFWELWSNNMIFSRHIFVYSNRLWPLLVHHDQELPITFGLQVDFCAISCNSSDKASSDIIAVGNHKGTTLEQSWFLCCMCVDTSGRWMSPHGSTQLLHGRASAATSQRVSNYLCFFPNILLQP